MALLGPRRYRRSILRSYVTELHSMGLFDDTRARASPELAPLLEDPRRAPALVEPACLDELLAIVASLRGRGAVRELGYRNMKGGGIREVLEPIVHLALSILGTGPGSLFARAPAMSSVVVQGIELAWTPSGTASGTMRMRCDEPVKELSWAAWEGVFLYACEVAGTVGTIGASRPAPDGRSCDTEISWEKAK